MKNTAAITAAEDRAARAEAAALASEIRLAIARDRLAELETEVARRSDAEAERAVRQLVSAGAIGKGDVFTHYEWKQKFLDDPELIDFVAMKPFNRRRP